MFSGVFWEWPEQAERVPHQLVWPERQQAVLVQVSTRSHTLSSGCNRSKSPGSDYFVSSDNNFPVIPVWRIFEYKKKTKRCYLYGLKVLGSGSCQQIYNPVKRSGYAETVFQWIVHCTVYTVQYRYCILFGYFPVFTVVFPGHILTRFLL